MLAYGIFIEGKMVVLGIMESQSLLKNLLIIHIILFYLSFSQKSLN